MSYFAPYIDTAGLHIPAYQDVENLLTANAQTIFGSDIYLGSDSQDFQDIAARAKAIYDTFLTAQLVYNNFSPVTAVGIGLDDLVQLNGLTREAASFSTATVTITGTAFTVITSGVVADINGNLWSLPASVTIGSGGTVSATATCQTAGAVNALSGQISIINTPTLGWTSVTNALAASPGLPLEADAYLRSRQAVSVANPSQALTTGILGGVLAVTGVSNAQLYENDTGSPENYINGVYNPSGYPAHSISVVVNGGADAAVAQAIALRKTPGCYTNGSTSVTVYDSFGVPTNISFTRPTSVTIYSTITITPLVGYSSTIANQIQTNVTNYINSLAAGQSVIVSEIWQAALTLTTPRNPTFSLNGVTAGTAPSPVGTTDLPMNYNQEASTVIGNINIVVL